MKNRQIAMQKFGLPLLLILVILLMQVFRSDIPLFSPLNIKNIFVQTVSVSLTALGLSFIMIAGEGDMSFAGMFSLLATVFALAINRFDSLWFSFLLVMAISLVVYTLIAYLVTRKGFSSFIVSIAIMFMAIGIEKALHQQTTLVENETFRKLATFELGIPVIVLIMGILFVFAYIIVNQTKFGFNLRVIGENDQAGIEAGILPKRMKFAAYLAAAIFISLAASIESLRVGAIYLQGQNYMLPIFAACYLGSSMFMPGRVNIIGTFVGALFMGTLGAFMNMMNVESFIIPIVQGGILIGSVGFASFSHRDSIQQVKV